MTFRLVILAALAVVLVGTHWKAYVFGGNAVRVEWQEEQLQAEQQAENNRLLAQAAINKIDRAGAAKAKKQAATDQSILAKVESNVPNTLPLLPGSFRVQHDSDATGEEADDTRTSIARPVAPKDVARTVSANYADARSDKERLRELQKIARESGCFDIED
jgi:hypothetical protein